MLTTREFCFLNLSCQARTAVPWFGGPSDSTSRCCAVADLPKLWFYHLNYCDFVNLDLSEPEDASLLASALDLALHWIYSNRRGKPVAWDPYPLSLRVVNWLKFVARNARAAEALGRGSDVEQIVESIADQASWLTGHTEEDLGGNHLAKNAKALLFAGAFLDCAESARWWSCGQELLSRELDEQVLGDGGHFERSPMYHCQVLEDLLDIEAVASSALRAFDCISQLRAAIARMSSFLRAILHPDGEIPLLNDSAFGMATPAYQLLRRAQALERQQHQQSQVLAGSCSADGAAKAPATITVLAHSGYAVLRDRSTSSFAILDCGPLGPDYQPGHGHCDLLSYELSLDGQRIVVDTGVSTYEPGGERLYQRSTAAHNTVRVDGEEQAEIWASFRVGRRPAAGSVHSGNCECSLGGITWVRGSHSAYAHRGVLHTRTLAVTPANIWFVIDVLEGKGRHQLDSFIHFHPSVAVERSPAERREQPGAVRVACTLSHAGKRYALMATAALDTVLGSTWYAPEFGRREQCPVISSTWQGELPARLAYAFVPLTGATVRMEDLAAAVLEVTSSFLDNGVAPISMRP